MEMVVWKAINFKEIYFKKYMEQIKLLKNFKMLEKEIMRKNYKLKFGYSLEKVFGSTIYFINVGVYDKQDNLVAVPKNSVYYDDLGTLLVTSSAVKYNHKRGIVDELPLDEEEITEDIKLILNYLMNT